MVEDMTSLSKLNLNIPNLFLPKSITETIDLISYDLSCLRTAIEYSMRYDTTEGFLTREIDERILLVLDKATTFHAHPGYVSAMGLSIRIFLHLSSDRFPISATDLGVLASDLKAVLSEPDTRLCTTFELTMWQLFVGSVATAADPSAGSWFRETLWKVSRAFLLSDWTRVLGFLDRAFMPDSRLLTAFEEVWKEVMALNSSI